jgi:hypothetical protein
MNPQALLAGALGATLLAIASFFGGMHLGDQAATARWGKEKTKLQADQNALLLAEIDKRHADQLANDAKTRKASHDYEDALAAKDRDYAVSLAAVKHAGGLRIPATVCPATAAPGTQAAGASRPDEAGPGTVELPERTQQRLFSLTDRADSLAEQLRALQGWIRDNGFYGEAQNGPTNP